MQIYFQKILSKRLKQLTKMFWSVPLNFSKHQIIFNVEFFQIILLEHLVIQTGRIIFLNTLWSTNDHKLIIFKMIENPQFQSVQSSYRWEIPYIYFTQLSNFSNNLSCQMENMNFYQYYPVWNPSNGIQDSEDHQFAKGDDSQAIEQTSAGTKSLQILQKPKRTQAPRFRPTKNNESNICNQAFSFMTNENKSKNILENLFKNKTKTQIFYDYSKYLSSKRKKYMSKGTLLKLCMITEATPQIQQIIKVKKFNILTLKQFESGVRFLILYFLKYKATSSILTSQKIAPNLKKDHFNKVREILNFVEQNLDMEKQIVKNSIESFPIKLEY